VASFDSDAVDGVESFGSEDEAGVVFDDKLHDEVAKACIAYGKKNMKVSVSDLVPESTRNSINKKCS